jgi:hypothetical protein
MRIENRKFEVIKQPVTSWRPSPTTAIRLERYGVGLSPTEGIRAGGSGPSSAVLNLKGHYGQWLIRWVVALRA